MYIVLTAVDRCPSRFGTYRKVAVVQLKAGFEGTPKMISSRARGVEAIVKVWSRCNVGSTDRCAYRIALAEAVALASALNSSACAA